MKPDNKSLHILLVCSHLNVAGGLERMVVSLANLLSQNRYRVSILIIGNTEESFYPIHSAIPITLLNIDFGIGNASNYIQGKVDFIKDIIKFRKAINSIHPDYIITTEYPQTVAAVFGRLYRKYKIVAWQLSSFYQKKSNLWKWLASIAYKKVACIVCLNKDEQTLYNSYNAQTIVIPNFIQPVNGISALDTKLILTVSRLSEEKGIYFLMQAAEIVLHKYPGWKWKIIGNGSLKKALLNFINKNSLSDRLIIQEPLSAVNEEYLQSSLYVMTSKLESFGMVLLEAMSHGVPCIAFDCDTGPRHIITNTIDGILVEKENVEQLAEAIATLIEGKGKLGQMGKAAFESSKKFSSTDIVKKWEELFNKLLQP